MHAFLNKKKWAGMIASAVTFVALYAIHIALRQRYGPGEGPRLWVAAALIASVGWLVLQQVRGVRSMDEYHRKIYSHAMAIAFPFAFVAVFAFGFLRGEGLFSAGDPRDLPALLLIFYLIGFVIATRRYR